MSPERGRKRSPQNFTHLPYMQNILHASAKMLIAPSSFISHSFDRPAHKECLGQESNPGPSADPNEMPFPLDQLPGANTIGCTGILRFPYFRICHWTYYQ